MSRPHIEAAEIASRSAPSPSDVRAELDNVLASPHFQASSKRRAFLSYIIEEALAGRADRLKGYAIAVDVYGRDETFNAKADPLIRLEARRLRRDLHSYYGDAGSADGVIISIPKGAYVPHFERPKVRMELAAPSDEAIEADPPAPFQPPEATDVASRRWSATLGGVLIAALFTAVAISAGATWYVTSGKPTIKATTTGHEPAIVVLPFDVLNASADSRFLAGGIRHEIVSNLMRFPGFRLYSASPRSMAMDDAAQPAWYSDAAYVVSGSVNTIGANVRVTIELADVATGRMLLAKTYDRPATPTLIRTLSEIASEIATSIGQPYGAVNADLNDRLAATGSNKESYICVLRGYDYRRGFAVEKFEPALQCLRDTVRREPGYSDAWAMLGWLYMDAGRIGYGGNGRRAAHYERALDAASRAVKLAPNNILALKALAAVYHYSGRYEDSERLVSHALELNPNDPGTLAQLGWRLAARGNFEDGIPLLKRAISRTVNPPGWYYHLIAVDLCLQQNYSEMLSVAKHSAAGGRGVSQALIAIAAAELGEVEEARRALEKMAQHATFADNPADYLRRHGLIEKAVDRLMAGLEKAKKLAARS